MTTSGMGGPPVGAWYTSAVDPPWAGWSSEVGALDETERLKAENEALRARLAGLTGAILRINEALDVDSVLQEVADSARSLSGARYSAITTTDEAGGFQHLVVSGMTEEEWRRVYYETPDGWDILWYLSGLREPLRTRDLDAHMASLGFSGFPLPVGAFLGLQIREGERHVGHIYLAMEPGGPDFTQEDEETLQIFAAQAAMAITNARVYGEEQREKANLEVLVNTSPVGVLVFDAKTRGVVRFNREALRIVTGARGTALAFDELLRTVSYRRMDGGAIAPQELPLERAATSGESVRAEEVVFRLPDGTETSTLVNATPIWSEDGEVVSVVVTVQDITPLEELERLRAEFLGVVSHELRAPLTSIKGSAATVLTASSPLDQAEILQFFRIVEERADHMRDLINNLLDLTRIEAGTLSIAPEPTDVTSVIELARNAFLSGGYKNSVEIGTAPHLPRILSDGHRIVQVLHNLFTNASRYSREWSSIRVAAWLEELHVAISVTDEGTGIPTEFRPYLFSKFARAESGGRTHELDGYGLGLAICKGIVEAHGGRIWAESPEQSPGTRVVFTVPVVDEAAAGIASPGEEARSGPAQEALQSERILVVDDDPQILRYVRNTLSQVGYVPTVTADPEEMNGLLEAVDPDLVLLNLVLPGTDGFELMKGIPGETPVIFLSGRGRGQDIAKAFEMGAADYVVKPFSPTELVARVRATLRRRSSFFQRQPFAVGELSIDFMERTVSVAGSPVPMTPTEYKLLYELSANAGRVVTHDQIIQRVWGEGHTVDERLLRSYIKNLRQKLGDDARNPSYIFTASRTGYRFAEPGAGRTGGVEVGGDVEETA